MYVDVFTSIQWLFSTILLSSLKPVKSRTLRLMLENKPILKLQGCLRNLLNQYMLVSLRGWTKKNRLVQILLLSIFLNSGHNYLHQSVSLVVYNLIFSTKLRNCNFTQILNFCFTSSILFSDVAKVSIQALQSEPKSTLTKGPEHYESQVSVSTLDGLGAWALRH